jgi:hypothetical protein
MTSEYLKAALFPLLFYSSLKAFLILPTSLTGPGVHSLDELPRHLLTYQDPSETLSRISKCFRYALEELRIAGLQQKTQFNLATIQREDF